MQAPATRPNAQRTAQMDAPGGGGGAAVLPVDVALARARALLGTTIDSIMGWEFDGNYNYAVALVGGATAAMASSGRGGLVVLNTTAAAGSNGLLYRAAATGGQWCDSQKGSLWYQVARMRLDTAVDANTYLSLISMPAPSGNPGLYVGGIGVRSTTHFSYDFYNSAGVNVGFGSLGVPLDNAFHLVEMWGDLTNFNVAIDGVTVLTFPIPALFLTPFSMVMYWDNGATAAARTMTVDYAYFLCARAT